MLSLSRSIAFLAASAVLIECVGVTTAGPALADSGDSATNSSSSSASGAHNTSGNTTKKTSKSKSSTSVGASTIEGSFGRLQLPSEIGRIEGSRDMNIFQLEPTVINEKYYVSGQAERHQNIGQTLPLGAPIPDCDDPVPPSTSQRLITPSSEVDKKIDAELSKRLAQESDDDDTPLTLNVVVTDTDDSTVAELKSLDAEVLSIDKTNHVIHVRVNKGKKTKARGIAKRSKVVYLYASP